ncbi:glycosyltransferase [Haloferula chungangensis]|uniref:Glycosyltransferase n=1 Tax=Haloferula chungangensis TaxID=1048331 RepID=A0ABW2L5J6_9BACT
MRDQTRILIAIGQTPFDPTSGAAQATLHLAEMLAAHGHQVRSLSTTGTEGEFAGTLPSGKFVEAQVHHHILPVPAAEKHSWHHLVGKEYDSIFDQALKEFQPDLLLTFGDEFPDTARRQRAVGAGTKVVFCLHNHHYRSRLPLHVDAFLTPSTFLAEDYRKAWGKGPEIQSLPTPVSPERARAAQHEPVFTTFINPQPTKGLWFMIRLADYLGRHHPDIPLRIVEGRASAAAFLSTARQAGIELQQFPNLFFSPNLADVREIWSTTRILLAPSTWQEPAGRVAVEAMLNGAVPIVSDRGGLAEQVGQGGIVLPLPESLTPTSRVLPSLSSIRPWIDAIVPLCHDDCEFSKRSEQARTQAASTAPDRIIGDYENFMRRILF